MKSKIHLLLSVLLFLSVYTFAQPFYPLQNELFRTDVLPRVDIEIHPDTLVWIYGNVDSNQEFKAVFVFSNGTVKDTLVDVGFRLRGNTSRQSHKKSFKVSFNTYEKGRKYYGVEKMNLNGEHNDPSVIRSHLSWNIFENMKVPGSRSNHVDVYINNDYYGLYINVEHVDEEFIEKRFTHNIGNLYKCLYPADMRYLGDNKNDYKQNGYELKTNTSQDDYTDLIALTKILQNSASSELPTNLEPIFNVNAYLRYLAVEVFIGHWDGYSFNKNNYYLFNNVYTGKMEFLPYDPDNTFSIDWFGQDWGTRNIYSWYSDWESRPLTEKLLDNQVYRDRYSYFLNELVSNFGKPSNLFPLIDEIKLKIDASAQKDTFRVLDYGWDFAAYVQSYTTFNDQHVKQGLKDYITVRVNSINSQIDLNAIAPIVENVYHNFPSEGDTIKIKANVSDDTPNATAKLFWRLNDNTFQELYFTDKGETLFVSEIAPLNESGIFEYYIEATDTDNKVTRDPFEGAYEIHIGSSNVNLVISEFMASNSSSVYDNYGQTEDWIEIKNTGTSSVNLGDKYLTDDLLDRSKWKMPNVDLAAGEYYLVWADNDTEQGENHTNFKLSANGEFLGIFDAFASSYAAIDTFTYGIQVSDLSEGLLEDNIIGTQAFITPMFNNEDNNCAYINFTYDMSLQSNLENFDLLNDYIDLPGTFNNWTSNIKFVDNNIDGLIKFTVFGLIAGKEEGYKARINGEWPTSESIDGNTDGNRYYTLNTGKNELEHWYNNESVVGIGNDEIVTRFKMYPNPFIGQELTIVSEHIENITIFSNVGAVVYTSALFNGASTIHITNFSKGIYLVQLTAKNGTTKVEKLLVQ